MSETFINHGITQEKENQISNEVKKLAYDRLCQAIGLSIDTNGSSPSSEELSVQTQRAFPALAGILRGLRSIEELYQDLPQQSE